MLSVKSCRIYNTAQQHKGTSQLGKKCIHYFLFLLFEPIIFVSLRFTLYTRCIYSTPMIQEEVCNLRRKEKR